MPMPIMNTKKRHSSGRGLLPGRAKTCEPQEEAHRSLDAYGSGVFLQTTSVSSRIPRTTLWALCTAIPIQALR
jgi:hypothetical protein